MKKIVLALVSLLLVIVLVPSSSIDGTSGKLKSASICSSGGYVYGNHGDGHWHYAEERSSGWYPQGASLGYENPCAVYNAPVEQQAPVEVYEEPVQNTAPIITLTKENIEIYSTEMGNIDSKKLISMFVVNANDSEDGDLTSKITVEPNAINLSSIIDDEQITVKFSIVDSEGLESFTEGSLSIIKNTPPVITYKEDFKVDKNSKCPNVIEQLGLLVTDKEDGDLKVTCEMININHEKGTIRIDAIDSANAGTSETIQYKQLSNKSKTSTDSWSVIPLIGVVAVVGGIVYFRNKKKKSLNK